MDIGEHDLRLRFRLDWNCESSFSSPSPSLFRLNKFKSRLVYDVYELFETHDTVLSILSRSSLAASRFGDNLLGQCSCRAWQSDRGKMERVKSVPARETCQEAAYSRLRSTTDRYRDTSNISCSLRNHGSRSRCRAANRNFAKPVHV